MKFTALFAAFFVVIIAFTNTACSKNKGVEMDNTIYNFEVIDINGETTNLEKYKNNVILVVNVASKCGFTPQYDGLQKLYDKYKDQGLVILGFPCNQFGSQEPGTNEEIKEFCSTNYGVKFPMFDKINVNGENTHPLYKYLKNEAPGSLNTKAIKWNFTKFLIDKNGKVIDRFSSATSPEQLDPKVKELL